MRTKHFYLTDTEAAAQIESTIGQLQYCRANGGGPRFVRQGRRVYYRLSDLASWARLNKQAPPEWFDRLDRRRFPRDRLSRHYEDACEEVGLLGLICVDERRPAVNFLDKSERNRHIDDALATRTRRRARTR